MSIKRKIILSFLAVSLMIGLLGGLTFIHETEKAEEVAKHEAASLAKTVSLFIALHIPNTGGSPLDVMGVELQELISSFKRTEGRDIVVVDMQQRIIADAVPWEIGSDFLHDRKDEVGQTLKDGKIRTFIETSSAYPRGIKQIVVPIELNSGVRTGGLVMEYTPLYTEILAGTLNSAQNFLIFFLIALIISMLIGFVISEHISMPLKEMKDAAVRISSGDLGARVGHKSSDELGVLATHFNSMAEDLQDNIGLLVNSRQELITEVAQRRQKEDALRKANIQINTLINAIPDMVYFKDTDGRHLVVNRAFERFMGLKEQSIVGKTNEELLPPDLAEACRNSDEAVMRGNREMYLEEAMIKGSEKVFFDTVKVPTYDETGTCTGLVGVSRDVTERRASEDALRVSEKKLRTLFDSANDAIFILDLEGGFIDVNRAAYERLGYTKEEMLSMKIAQLDPPEFAAILPERMVQIMERTCSVFESAHRRKDGTVMPVEVNARQIELEGRQVVFSVIRDVTERKQAEDRITAALLEKDILLKEVHHRVKNNLQIIASLLQLQAGYISDKWAKALFDESRKRVETMSLIHEKLYRAKDLARIDFSEYVNDLVSNLFALHTGKADSTEVAMDIEGLMLDVNNSIPCGLIINELVSNSLKHAFPDGRKGRILIDMRSTDKGDISLGVKDNGTGFPEQIDFRNTKSLGLQLVISLVTQLEGIIELDRSEGTCFTIRFTP